MYSFWGRELQRGVLLRVAEGGRQTGSEGMTLGTRIRSKRARRFTLAGFASVKEAALL
jgi:hypothetical protein